MRLKLTTWNVNSIRLRTQGLRRLVREESPDVLCLQETKVEDALFPHDLAHELGYPYRIVRGEKSYNGVAILSRHPLKPLAFRDWCRKGDCRHAAAMVCGIELHNFYVPAGGDVPDPEANPKFAHKLRFLSELARWCEGRRKPASRLVLLGDLNVAPLETDVWSHTQLLKVVSHTPVEVAALSKVMAALGWLDAVRHFIPPSERLYSWWSYRARDWAASDRGRRLDHIWVAPSLKPHLAGASVLKDARGWRQPSDHVPVSAVLGA